MITASIVGASGYVGGEALRLLIDHPKVEVVQATSERNKGKFVHNVHPNLRNRTKLKFSSIDDLEKVDVLFLALPHGLSAKKIDYFMEKADYIIDKGADFRLSDPNDYESFYGKKHPRSELLKKFVYGIPELHRDEIRHAKFVAAAGCNATASILALYPIRDLIEDVIIDVKAGSSQGGASPSSASHHPERSDVLRSYAPTNHRHMAEIDQETGLQVSMSATSVDLVRGILATCHVTLKKDMEEKEFWKIYRKAYGNEPFMRIVKERTGIYRYPEPKILWGTNYCDVGFEKGPGKRLVVMSALDNLMKGAAGQAVQCMNIMLGFEEALGLEFAGLHPV